MRVEDINFDDILLNGKYFLTHDISYKTFMGASLFRISFDKVDGTIKIYNNPDDYDDKDMKIKLNYNDKLTLNKMIETLPTRQQDVVATS